MVHTFNSKSTIPQALEHCFKVST
uniref:Uncharacterized protein n=1 Tax=Arundo donax TaxID=35708 RepID=A0A0A9BME2_ARUDO